MNKGKMMQTRRTQMAWCLKFGIAVSTILLLISAYMTVTSLMKLKKSQESFEAMKISEEEERKRQETDGGFESESETAFAISPYSELKQENIDLFGWIKILGTKLDYPVMYRPQDSEFYLHRDFKKNDSVSGVPFLDGKYKEDGNHYLIYGHNMKNGTMFHELLNYAEPDYWKEHPFIEFDTMQENASYEVIGAFYSRIYYQNETDVFRFYACQDLSTPEMFSDYVKKVEEASLYDTGQTAEYGDTLLTLVTCSYHTKNGRFVVVARK